MRFISAWENTYKCFINRPILAWLTHLGWLTRDQVVCSLHKFHFQRKYKLLIWFAICVICWSSMQGKYQRKCIYQDRIRYLFNAGIILMIWNPRNLQNLLDLFSRKRRQGHVKNKRTNSFSTSQFVSFSSFIYLYEHVDLINQRCWVTLGTLSSLIGESYNPIE